jgi:two-component system, response regulator, stage 0 sporulation protein A
MGKLKENGLRNELTIEVKDDTLFIESPTHLEAIYYNGIRIPLQLYEAKERVSPRENHELVSEIHAFLKTFSSFHSLKGYDLLVDALLMGMKKPEILLQTTKECYPYLARQHHITPSLVERRIRTLIEKWWYSSNKKSLQKKLSDVFHKNHQDRPSNSEFVAMLLTQFQFDRNHPSRFDPVITRCLSQLCIVPVYNQSYLLLHDTLEAALKDPAILDLKISDIYRLMCQRYENTTPYGVERSFRHVVDTLWEDHPNLLQRILGDGSQKKPSVRRFLTLLFDKLADEEV